MTLLTTWPEAGPDEVLAATRDPRAIRAALAADGIRFDRWEVVDLPPAAGTDDALAAYAGGIAEVCRQEGYSYVDAVALRPHAGPGWPAEAAAARATFLAEHTHADDEDRFFARGSGVFYLHVGGRVHAVLCEAGDLLSVPAGVTHWFDMGTSPDYIAVRFFHDDGGWEATFTGDAIAARFPTYDELAAASD